MCDSAGTDLSPLPFRESARFQVLRGMHDPASPATPKPEPSQSPITVREPDGAAALDGERKTVTALFADIKGSRELMAELDPEEARSIIDPALKLMIDAVRKAWQRRPLK